MKNKDILPAFYFALRDTLVAKDLDQATRVGLQGATRYRVVTLKGELIDLSGMTLYEFIMIIIAAKILQFSLPLWHKFYCFIITFCPDIILHQNLL